MRKTLLVIGCALVTAGCSARAGVGVGVEAAVLPEAEVESSDRVWVCHRGRWQDVAAPAAGGHSRHGDRISRVPRESRGSC